MWYSLIFTFLVIQVNRMDAFNTIPKLQGITFDVPSENMVYILEEENFDEVVKKQPFIVVQFYESDDRFIRYLEYEYEHAAELAARDYRIPFARVDVGKVNELKHEYLISQHFEIKIFIYGHPLHYLGPEDTEGMVKFLENYMDPSWDHIKDECIELSDDNFDSMLENKKLSLLLAYKDDHRSIHQWENFKNSSSQLKHFFNITLFRVNTDLEPKLAKRLNVSHIPELYFCRFNKCYHNLRYCQHMDDIFTVLLSLLRGGREVKSIEHYEWRRRKHEHQYVPTFIAMLNREDLQELDVLEHAIYAFQHQYYIFYTFNQSFKSHYGCDAHECFRVVYPTKLTFEEDEEMARKNMLKNDDLLDEEKVFKYIMNYNLPLVTYKHYYSYLQTSQLHKNYPMLVIYGNFSLNDFTNPHGEEEEIATQKFRRELIPLAKKIKPMPLAISHFNSILPEILKIDHNNQTLNIVILDEHRLSYVMPDDKEFNDENILEFISDFNKHKIDPSDRSLPEPLVPVDHGLEVITTSSFKRKLIDYNKDILLFSYIKYDREFYYHHDVIEKLVKMFHQNHNARIAKIDRRKNYLPFEYFNVERLKIYLIINGQLWNPIIYDGQFDALEILEFVEKHSEKIRNGWHDHITDEL